MKLESTINSEHSEYAEYAGNGQYASNGEYAGNGQYTNNTKDAVVYYRPPDKARHLQLLKLMVASALLLGVVLVLLFLFAWQYNLPQTHVAGVSDVNQALQEAENQNGAQNGNHNSNQNGNTVEVNVNIPLLALPSNGTVWMDNPMILSGYGQPGLYIQIIVDGSKIPITSIDENGEWSTNVNLGAPGTHKIQMVILNQNNQVINVSQVVEVVLLEPVLGEIIKEHPTLPSCGEVITAGNLASNQSMSEDSNVWVIPDEAYPILCVDESVSDNGTNGTSGTNASPTHTQDNTNEQATPIPVTDGKG